MIDFTFKPFNEMTPEDYKTIGFKSGLEIHQQVLTKKKLFCRCPAGKYSNHYHAEILRHMRPTLSELGEYDGTALMEFKTKKEIIYRINRATVCTYEMDDTPPFQINDEALDIVLGLGMLYNCSIVDEIHIARKQYLDGSIPTGFQRTSIFALDGSIPYNDRNISIIQLSIEEDACREVSDIGHQRIYLTDRLGMPLVETVTGPDMKTPQEVAEVADICRRLVRSTGKVRTGIGAAREDVNVSVDGGTRIEIKGVSKISAIPMLVYNEAMRQWNLLKLREELTSRGITTESFEAKCFDITKLIGKNFYEPLRASVLQGSKVKCVLLKGYKGLLHWQTQTDTYFSHEISDRVRVIACLSHYPNIIHSDSKGETLISSEWQKVRKATSATENDTMVIVWGNEGDVETATNEIIIRAKEATIGIPSETRQANWDGTNGFERILPGPERMYPDTDLPPKQITQERLDGIRSWLPKPIWVREDEYQKMGITYQIAKTLAYSKYAELFEQIISSYEIKPITAAVFLTQTLKDFRRGGYNITLLSNKIIKQLFQLLAEGKISKNGLKRIAAAYLKDGKQDIFESYTSVITDKEILKVIKQEIKSTDKLSFKSEENKERVLLGRIMKLLDYKVEAKKVLNLINGLKEVK